MSVSGLVERTVDINKGITVEPLGRLFATNDAEAHTFKINLMASGKPVPLDGAGVVAYFMRAVGESTVAVKGSASGNVVTVTLPESCYAVTSRFQIVIKVSQEAGNVRTTVYAGHGWVTRVSTDKIVDPGGVIPSLEELLARIGEMEAATQAAQSAAQRADAAADRADAAEEKTTAAVDRANALTDQWDDVSLEYEVLPAKDDPYARLEQTEHDTKFLFGLPHSDLAYSTFYVNDDMELIMESPENFGEFTFSLHEDGCLYLEVL